MNGYLPDRGNFDTWAADPGPGGQLNLAELNLVEKRNHILAAAIETLPDTRRQLLSTLALLSEAVDYDTLVTPSSPAIDVDPSAIEMYLVFRRAARAGHMTRARQRRFARPWTADMATTSNESDTVMNEDENDDRFEAALRLAEDDPARGAEALRSIVADSRFDPDDRFEAAARLAEVDEAKAAEALRSIVADNEFDPDTRSEAAARLAEIGG